MITLGIDSSTDILAIGLADNKKILAEKKTKALRDHASRILPMIDDIFSEAGHSRDQLDGVAIAIGPGSFTGLRIGLSVAKGAAVSKKIPILGISTFELIYDRVRQKHDRFALISVSRRGEFYLYHASVGAFNKDKMTLIAEAELSKISGDLPLGIIGRKPENWGAIAPCQIEGELLFISGGELALLGARRMAAGEHEDASLLEPWYLAPSQAEINFGRK